MESKEKILNIPLRSCVKKSINKRIPYSARIVREFIRVHMKADVVKLGKHLNEQLWENSKKNTRKNIRVSIVNDDGVIKAELIGHKYEDFKPIKKESKPSNIQEKIAERLGPKATKTLEDEKKIEGEKKEETKNIKPETEKTTEVKKESDQETKDNKEEKSN